MKNHLLKTFGGGLRRLSLLCCLMLASLGVHADVAPGEVTYYDNGDGTAGFKFEYGFMFGAISKLVIPETWNGLPIKTYGGFEYYDEYDWEYYWTIDTLIVEAQIERIDDFFPAADVMYFPKSLKVLNGPLVQWGDYYQDGSVHTSEVYFEAGSKLEILGKDLLSSVFAQYYQLQEFEIPSKMKVIGPFAFAGQQLYNACKYPLPKGLQTIGMYAFAGTTTCAWDEDGRYTQQIDDQILVIPASVRSIGTGAFENCVGIKTVVIEDGTNLTIEKGAFSGYEDNSYDWQYVQTVICKSTTPFKMYSGENPDYESYDYEDQSYNYPIWGGGTNFPNYERGKKPRLYVPDGYKEFFEAYWTIDEDPQERKQYKDIFDIREGITWGTIVVPNKAKAFLMGISRLAELKSCEVKDGDNWRLIFDEIPVTFDTELTKGKPYICMPPNIRVTGSSTVTPVTVMDNGYTITFTGNLTNGSSYVPNGAYYFGGVSGKCYLNEREDNVVTLANGRCYFEVTAPSSAKPLAMSVVMNELDGSRSDVTAIGDVFMTQNKDVIPGGDATYNLQGVRMSNSGTLPKGIYIRNGKKVVIK